MKNNKQEILNEVMGCHVCNYFTCKPRDFLCHTCTKRHLMKTSQNSVVGTDDTLGSNSTTGATNADQPNTTGGTTVKRRKRTGKRDDDMITPPCDPQNYVCIQRQISKDEFDDFNIIEAHEFDVNLHITSEDDVFANLPDTDITDDDDADDTEDKENDDAIYETVYTNPRLVVEMFPNFFHRLFHTIHVLLNVTKDTILDILFEPVRV